VTLARGSDGSHGTGHPRACKATALCQTQSAPRLQVSKTIAAERSGQRKNDCGDGFALPTQHPLAQGGEETSLTFGAEP